MHRIAILAMTLCIEHEVNNVGLGFARPRPAPTAGCGIGPIVCPFPPRSYNRASCGIGPMQGQGYGPFSHSSSAQHLPPLV